MLDLQRPYLLYIIMTVLTIIVICLIINAYLCNWGPYVSIKVFHLTSRAISFIKFVIVIIVIINNHWSLYVKR